MGQNIASNWYVTHNGAGLRTYIAPKVFQWDALPETMKLIGSGAFPLLLFFVVEATARSGLRFEGRKFITWALPATILIIFAFSVGEVSRFYESMGMTVPLSILFALGPDMLITAGVVALQEIAAQQKTQPVPQPEQELPLSPPPDRGKPTELETTQVLPIDIRQVAPVRELTLSVPQPTHIGSRNRIDYVTLFHRIAPLWDADQNKGNRNVPSERWLRKQEGVNSSPTAQKLMTLFANRNAPELEQPQQDANRNGTEQQQGQLWNNRIGATA